MRHACAEQLLAFHKAGAAREILAKFRRETFSIWYFFNEEYNEIIFGRIEGNQVIDCLIFPETYSETGTVQKEHVTLIMTKIDLSRINRDNSQYCNMTLEKIWRLEKSILKNALGWYDLLNRQFTFCARCNKQIGWVWDTQAERWYPTVWVKLFLRRTGPAGAYHSFPISEEDAQVRLRGQFRKASKIVFRV